MMMSLTAGRERGKKDWDAIFASSGWVWKDIIQLEDSAVSVVEATLAKA